MSPYTEYCQNPIITDAEGMDHGDPFVLRYLDTYYLYHTGKQGVKLYTSTDLVHWTYQGIALKANGPGEHWAQTDLWAPEVLYDAGVFYMYVAATRLSASGKSDDQARRQGLARSKTPLGPFVWDDAPLIPQEWSIDGHPYRDSDGQLWLFYNIRTEATRHPDGTTGCGNVVDRLTRPDQLEGTQDVVTFPTDRWEGNAPGTWYWNEGPCVLKRHGVYYQMYSGGCYRDGTYAIGYATAPHPRGPWTKFAGNPILYSKEGILGPGHHCVVKAPDGVTPYIVYHGYLPRRKGRKVHLDRLFWVGDRLSLIGPTTEKQPLPPGPVYDAAVPHWHLAAWVCGAAVRIDDRQIPLTPNTVWHYVQAAYYNGQLQISVDGVLQLQVADATMQPVISAEGEVRPVTLTSWFDDEAVYNLQPGEHRQWRWGGSGPVEISLALMGDAVVNLQGADVEPLKIAASESYRHVHLTLCDGLDSLAVQAHGCGASVTDIVLTAR
jgi:GH43 family beta-xylosidase